MNGEATGSEFAGGLDEEVDTIDDEVELGNDSLLLVVVGQEMDVVVGEGGFSASLSMPDEASGDSLVEILLDCLGGEELRVAHDVLLVADLLFHVSDAVAEEELKSRRAEERGEEAVGGGVGSFIGGVFGGALDGEEIGIAQDEEFGIGRSV